MDTYGNLYESHWRRKEWGGEEDGMPEERGVFGELETQTDETLDLQLIKIIFM